MGFSKVVASIAILHLLQAGATRVRKIRQATTHHVAHDATQRQAHEVGMDIDESMSWMLADQGVIVEDTIGKPGSKHTIKIDSGKFKRNPFLHGTFQVGGAWGAAVAGAAATGVLVLPELFALGAGGAVAGDKAAELLERLVQGQGSIGISEDWKEPQPRQSIASMVMATNGQAPSQASVKKEGAFLSSVQQILGMGNRRSPLVDSIVTNTSRNSPALDAISGPKPGAALDAISGPPPAQKPTFLSSFVDDWQKPFVAMENTDRNVITGLGQALRSGNPDEVDDAKFTATLLEIVRLAPDGVEVVVY